MSKHPRAARARQTRDAPRKRARGIGSRLLVSAVALALALLALEAGLRLFGVKPERYAPPRWLVLHDGAFHDYGIWGRGLIKRPSRFRELGVVMGEYVPGAVFKVQYDDNPRGYFDADNAVQMTVGRLGFREHDRALDPAKPPGTVRILGLGDSFAFGVGVKDRDTFFYRLETALNADAGEHRFEVLNAGVQGYNTRDEILYLERHWLPMGIDPDIVLIVFYLNDAYSDSTFLNMGQTLGIQLEQPEGMAEVSRIWDLAQHKWRARRVSRETETYYKSFYFTNAVAFLDRPGAFAIDWTVSRTALEYAVTLGRQHGFKPGVVVFPELYRLDRGYPFQPIHDVVTEACRALDIPVLDLLDVYRGHDPRALWVHPSDHHPNERAHAMAAEALERFVRNELLPRDGLRP